MKLELLLNKKAQFTELIRINEFSNINHCLKIINEFFEEDEYPYYTENEDGRDYKYVHVSGDGQLYFVEQLNEFNCTHHTEQDWGVKFSIPMN